MQILIVWMIILSLWICTAPLAHPETVQVSEEVKTAEVPSAPAQQSPSGGLFQESLSEIVREAGIENPILSVKKTADAAARSVGRSLGQYIRGQYQQRKNEDILQRFDYSLSQNMAGLHLTPEERRRMIQKIQDDYIQDAESGKLELDQQNFRDLPKIVKKQYAEIELARTESGNVPTYDNKGGLKTLWAVKRGLLEGPAVTYYPDGEIKYIDLYKSGRKVNRKKFDEEGKLVFEQNYDYEIAAPAAASVQEPEVSQTPADPASPSKPETLAEEQAPASQTSDPGDGKVEVIFKEVKSQLSDGGFR